MTEIERQLGAVWDLLPWRSRLAIIGAVLYLVWMEVMVMIIVRALVRN